MDKLEIKSKHEATTTGQSYVPVPTFFKDNPDGSASFDSEPGKAAEFHRVVAQATGARNVAVSNLLLDQATCTRPNTMDNQSDSLNVTLAMLHEIEPKNALEGLLVTQMIGIHNLSMEMLKNASVSGQTSEAVDRCINRSVKLTRIFAAQVEALHKLRNGGQQKVTVEHVNVHAGGQAVVGNVAMKKGEGAKDGE